MSRPPDMHRCGDTLANGNSASEGAGELAPLFSLLVPTRGRPALLARFLESVQTTSADWSRIEIVLGLDADDAASRLIDFDSLAVRHAIGPPGRSMGQLNRDCLATARGRFLVLLNDDVVFRTPGWDDLVAEALRRFPDDIVLLFCNDELFRGRLATFPLVSRRAVQAIGLCPAAYARYRIDDHVFDVYQLLANLGFPRIVYLPEVIWSHQPEPGMAEPHPNVFQSPGGAVYAPHREQVERDEQVFVRLAEERRQDAVRLAALIDPGRPPAELAARLPQGAGRGHWRQRYTCRIAPQAEVPLLSEMLEVVPRRAGNLAGILARTRAKAIVLAGDGVRLTPEAIAALCDAIRPDVAVATLGVMSPNGTVVAGGSIDRRLERYGAVPGPVEGLVFPNPAAYLVDLRKVGFLRLDADVPDEWTLMNLGLLVWEQGYRVTSADGIVMRYTTTVPEGSLDCMPPTMHRRWIASGRVRKLAERVWSEEASFAWLE